MNDSVWTPDDVRTGVKKRRTCLVTARDIRRFAQAIGCTSAAPGEPEDDDDGGGDPLVAPPLFCQTFMFEDVAPRLLPPDGSPLELDVPIPVTKTVGGGSEYEIFRSVSPGDELVVTTTLKDVSTKQGRTGLLYFVVVETEFVNQRGEPVSREIATYIKRV